MNMNMTSDVLEALKRLVAAIARGDNPALRAACLELLELGRVKGLEEAIVEVLRFSGELGYPSKVETLLKRLRALADEK
jgi:hypothetical protein